jgi:hypothetical protein
VLPRKRLVLLWLRDHVCALMSPLPCRRLQADFRPSDLLCPETLCWVPHARVESAVFRHSGYINLAATPGALIDLGAEHGVASDGAPDALLTQVGSGLHTSSYPENPWREPPCYSCACICRRSQHLHDT